MHPTTLRFIKASLIYLLAGVTLGGLFTLDPVLGWRLRPVHAQINLFGGVSMLIFGIAYHIFPRFNGRALPCPRLADAHFWLANVALVILLTGWTLSVYIYSDVWPILMGLAGLGFAASTVMFVVNVHLVLKPTPSQPQ